MMRCYLIMSYHDLRDQNRQIVGYRFALFVGDRIRVKIISELVNNVGLAISRRALCLLLVDGLWYINEVGTDFHLPIDEYRRTVGRWFVCFLKERQLPRMISVLVKAGLVNECKTRLLLVIEKHWEGSEVVIDSLRPRATRLYHYHQQLITLLNSHYPYTMSILTIIWWRSSPLYDDDYHPYMMEGHHLLTWDLLIDNMCNIQHRSIAHRDFVNALQ